LAYSAVFLPLAADRNINSWTGQFYDSLVMFYKLSWTYCLTRNWKHSFWTVSVLTGKRSDVCFQPSRSVAISSTCRLVGLASDCITWCGNF